MVTNNIVECAKNFNEEIRAEAHARKALREEIFVEKMGVILEDYGEVENLISSLYQSTGMKVDGYHYDDEFKDITLIVSYFLDDYKPEKIKVTNTTVNTLFKQATGFLTRSLKDLSNKIEISNEAYELASLIAECRKEIRTAKIILITDGITKRRPADIEEINGIEVICVVWDIERTCHFCQTGEREKISVEFAEYCDGPLPCVVRKDNTGCYSTYLSYMPGSALADMYATWGIKMLDMNVRVFLTARGNINRQIRETIINEPEMFCAYNNGITVFAREIETKLSGNSTKLVRAEDFQIVNGGQTTASLFHTKKKDRAILDNIFVPMKLIIIHNPEDVDKIVPRISKFSNTQNKVQLADLAANQVPHPEIQAISNSTMVPDPTGGSQQTYWFYERARGSYEEFRNLTARTPAQKRQFDALRPKKQKFDKIKFGKAWHTCLRQPHIVSLGGQKNFARFNDWLREQKDEDWAPFFHKTVALLILWNSMERIVRRQKFQGYYHNIVAYSLAWLFHLTDTQIDLEKIWLKQKVASSILDILERMCHVVNEHIRDTSFNVTEYCKKEECWNKLKANKFSLPSSIKDEFITGENTQKYRSDISSESEAISYCKSKGGQAWYTLSKWLKDRNFLTNKARSQSFNMGKTLDKEKEPSVALSIPCKKIWEDATVRGWQYSPESSD
jgi:hypothetical protein|tara:strand:- start:81 stop:2108 length:2028 start_codon:yes stop_codon:yes gene_type:complete